MKLFLPILATGLAISGVASATTLSFVHTIPGATVPFTSSFTLSSFNTLLGTLTGVKIVLNDTTSATLDIVNVNSASASFSNASATVPLTIDGPGGVSFNASVTAGPVSGVADPGFNTFTGGTANNSATDVLAPSTFSTFETVAPQDLSFSALGGEGTYTGTGDFGVLFGGSATAGGTVEIDYTYNPVPTVPEPASWALMMIGVGAMGGVLRRRREAHSVRV